MKAKKRNTGVIKSVDRKDIEKHEIYSYAVSKAPGGPGRKKRITVRGIPGSVFNLLAQNENNEVYNFQRGGFSKGGSIFEAVIPPSGVFKGLIDTQNANNVDVRLDSAAPSVDTQVIVGSEGVFKLDITADTTGLSNLTVQVSSYGSQLIKYGSSTRLYFQFELTSAKTHVINLVRNPRFNFESSNADDDNGFVLYDGIAFKNGAGELQNVDAHFVNESGQKILSDFKYNPIADVSKPKFKVSDLKTELFSETEIADNSVGHSIGFSDTVVVKGNIDISSMGTGNTNLKLMLFNFLEVLAK